MPNYTNAWDKTLPLGTEAISQGDDRIRELKAALEERLATEHSDPSGSSGDALIKHLAGRCSVFYYGATADIAALTSPPQYAVAWDTTLQALKVYTGAAWSILFQSPYRIELNPFTTPTAQTNWSTITKNDNQILNGWLISSGAQNDSISWDVVIPAGTWTVSVVYKSGPSCGIISVLIDDVSKGTIDAYLASDLTYNSVGTVASIVVATSSKVTLKLKMATKNDSSSSYYGKISAVSLLRTA